MKNLLFFALLLSLGASIFAQQSDNGTSAELSKLRQNYVDSLNNLLRQCVKDNDLAGATAITKEIDKVSPPASTPDASPAASPDDEKSSPCGIWVWRGGVSLNRINPDGTVVQDSKTTRNTWRWVDEANRKLRIDWATGWVDHLTLSEDGGTMDVVNNDGGTFTVHRLPKDDPDAAQ